MDQGWKNEYYSLNIDMNIYWSVLNALHGGLAVWDVTKSFFNQPEETLEKLLVR